MTLRNDATSYGISVTEDLRDIGGFLHRHQGHFLQEDGIQVIVVDNGTGAKSYKIKKLTVDTVDESKQLLLDGFKKVNDDGGSDIPFL